MKSLISYAVKVAIFGSVAAFAGYEYGNSEGMQAGVNAAATGGGEMGQKIFQEGGLGV